MTLSFRKKTKKDEIVRARRKRMDQETGTGKGPLFAADKFTGLGLYLALCLVIVVICFLGQSPSSPVFISQGVARMEVRAEFPFRYPSQILTERKREQVENRVSPSYRISMEEYEAFATNVRKMVSTLNELEAAVQAMPEEERAETVDTFALENPNVRQLGLSAENLRVLLSFTTPQQRTQLIADALTALQEILREGVYNPTGMQEGGSSGTVFHLAAENGQKKVDPNDLQDALQLLRFNLFALDADSRVQRVLYSLLKRGLEPNLDYDEVQTLARIETARESVEPQRVFVEHDEVLIRAGEKPDALAREKYAAYRAELQARQTDEFGWSPDIAQRTLLTFALVGAAFLYARVSLPQLSRSRRRVLLFCSVLVLNLILMRLVLQLGETDIIGNSTTLVSVLRYALPVVIGPMILGLMIGSAPAVLLTILIASLNALMQGGSFEAFILSFLAGLVAVYFCMDVRTRAKLLRAGTLSGLAMALGAGFIGLFSETFSETPLLIAQQMIAAALTGAISAAFVIGLMPMLENGFKYITDITLLELTDYNHPLLRKMQMIAPGTYHHSLMVANLSERAAQEIGCNPLVCRAACLFHDVGKMVKPEYFIENQREGYNPHMEKNPSMSALIIKAHVKEGVEMARQAKLPIVIVDIIRQHHGTTLISYFYHRAVQQLEQPKLPLTLSQQPSHVPSDEVVDESSFRYDGPRPRFKESGIIFFADAVEAASRSLKKVTPQSVEEMIEGIFKERIDDHQLDDCPLTTQDLKKIRKSFAFTLLNMMHNRIEYPGKNLSQKSKDPARNPIHREPQQPAKPPAA